MLSRPHRRYVFPYLLVMGNPSILTYITQVQIFFQIPGHRCVRENTKLYAKRGKFDHADLDIPVYQQEQIPIINIELQGRGHLEKITLAH